MSGDGETTALAMSGSIRRRWRRRTCCSIKKMTSIPPRVKVTVAGCGCRLKVTASSEGDEAITGHGVSGDGDDDGAGGDRKHQRVLAQKHTPFENALDEQVAKSCGQAKRVKLAVP